MNTNKTCGRCDITVTSKNWARVSEVTKASQKRP